MNESRNIHFGAGLGLAAAAALLMIDISMPPRRMPRKLLATGRPSETTRKQFRAADRSKKQYLLKGIRP